MIQYNSLFAIILLFFLQPCQFMSFCCETEQQHFHYVEAWARSDVACKLKQERSLELHDADFYCFLNEFVSTDMVKDLFARRSNIDFSHRKAANLENYTELADLMITCDEKLKIREWYSELKKMLEIFNAKIHTNTVHAEPGTVVFSFEEYPKYVVKCLAWNYYPLGCYDAAGGYSCMVPGCNISGVSFPFQLVSRVLYAEEIKRFVCDNQITNVHAPEKWLYLFPSTKHEPLNDKNLFIVVQKINFDHEQQKKLVKKHLKFSPEAVTKEMLLKKSADIHDHSLLANIVRVILAVGVWDFTFGAENFVLLKPHKDCDEIEAFFIDTDRPAFGGGNPFNFFHKKEHEKEESEEIAFNARVGLDGLVLFLNHQNDCELLSGK